jgi:transcription termination factor Rho
MELPMSAPATTDDILPSFTPAEKSPEPARLEATQEAAGAGDAQPADNPAAENAPGATSQAVPEDKNTPPELEPRDLWIEELHELSVLELHERFAQLKMRANPEKTRHYLVCDLIRAYHQLGFRILAEGITEFITSDGCGFVRFPRYSFKPLPQDPFFPFQMAKKIRMRGGHLVTVRMRPPQHKEKYMMVDEVLTVEGKPFAEWEPPRDFETLTPRFPDARIRLDGVGRTSVTARAVDLIAPIGRGQRGLLVAPPRAGKTILMKELAIAALANNPGLHVILLLVDERPEEVTDLQRGVKGAEIYASTFDEPSTRHIQVADIVSDRAKRLVEQGKHVLIFLDSITRLSRGYNNARPGGGRIMTGGLDTKALVKPKKFFGSARNTEEAGSVTILATALVETHSKMDDIIFEEYKGTGNMEVKLDRFLSDRRVFPAIDLAQSATRRDDLLYHPDEFHRVQILRRQLAALPPLEATEVLIHALKKTETNAELVMGGLRG